MWKGDTKRLGVLPALRGMDPGKDGAGPKRPGNRYSSEVDRHCTSRSGKAGPERSPDQVGRHRGDSLSPHRDNRFLFYPLHDPLITWYGNGDKASGNQRYTDPHNILCTVQ